MKVAIFHGWGASPSDNWNPWLKSELEKLGHSVFVPSLPTSQNPNQDEWLDEARKLPLDEETIVIGHSLGTVLIMRLLEVMKFKSAFLVAGFNHNPNIEEIEAFFLKDFDYEKIKSNCSNITLLNSDNDPYIPMDITHDLQKKLDCALIVFEKMNHLSAGTDNLKFPELLDLINKGNKN